MEIIELRRGDFIYRGAAGRGMGVLKLYPVLPSEMPSLFIEILLLIS